MPAPDTNLSLSKQTLIRLIIDHSELDESIGTWAVAFAPNSDESTVVWVGRYPHPVEGRVHLEAGWKSIPLPRIRARKYTKRLGSIAFNLHVQNALAEGALMNWIAAQEDSDLPSIELT